MVLQNRTKKKKIADEIFEILADAYIVLIGVTMPLYMKNGMIMLGNSKYFFFMRTARIVIPLFLLLGLLRWIAEGHRFSKKALSPTDVFVLGYGVVMLLSYLFSSYRQTAKYGYPDWYMGLMTQFILVSSYFLISRCFRGDKIIGMLPCVASVIVGFIGLGNRYGFDPLEVFQKIQYDAWAHTELISTIGNINWYCAYICVTIPFVIYLFWGCSGVKRMIGAIGCVIEVGTLFTQGSASGYVAFAAMLTMLCFCSLDTEDHFRRFLELLLLVATVPVLMPVSWKLTNGMQLPLDGITEAVLLWKGWNFVFWVLTVGVLFVMWHQSRGKEDIFVSGKMKKVIGLLFAVIAILFMSCLLLCQFSDTIWQLFGESALLRINDNWGGERGVLWRTSLECFGQGGVKQKLFGAGPDCFACIVYEMFDMENRLKVQGIWQGSIFANAHNEWLNMLVTAGIMGLACYMGIFLSAGYRYMKSLSEQPALLIGLLALIGYAVNNSFSFQQIVATPVLFVVLGMAENTHRTTFRGKSEKDEERMECSENRKEPA